MSLLIFCEVFSIGFQLIKRVLVVILNLYKVGSAHIPGVSEKVSPFEHFQRSNHCLIVIGLNGSLLLKG